MIGRFSFERFARRAISIVLVFPLLAALCQSVAAAAAGTTEILYTQTPAGDLASYAIQPDGSLRLVEVLKVDWQQDAGSRSTPLPINLLVPPGSHFAYASDPGGRVVNMICYPIDQGTGALRSSKHCDSGQPISWQSVMSTSGQIFGVGPDAKMRVYSTDDSSEKLVPIGGAIWRGNPMPPLAGFGEYVYLVCTRCDDVRSLRAAGDGPQARAALIGRVPAGATPDAIAIDPQHRFVYVANLADSTISEYYVDPGTHSLRPHPKMQTAKLSAEPFNLVVEPTGRFLYVLGYPARSREEVLDPYAAATGALIDQFRIAEDGTLVSLGQPVRLFAGTSRFARNGIILADPSGKFIYVSAALPARRSSVTQKVIEGLRVTAGGQLQPLKSPPMPTFYDPRATISWIGPSPRVEVAQRDVTPLLKLKAPLEGAFRPAGYLTAVHGTYVYPNLMPDGRVFFLEDDPRGNIFGERYAPKTRTVAHLGLIIPRDDGPIIAATLADGKYLLRRSWRDKRAAIFDSETMRLTPKGYLREPCYRAYWLLNDGRILFPQVIEGAVWGYMGSVSPPCGGEIYASNTGESVPLPPALNKPFLQVLAKLPDGRLLFHVNPPYWDWRRFGGRGGHPGQTDPRFRQYDPRSFSLFDPKANQVRPAGEMPERLIDLTAATLSDGTVFIVGSMDDDPTGSRLSSTRAELYDPRSTTFAELGPLPQKRDGGSVLTVLKAGRVLISGTRNDVELFDPTTKRFSPGGSMDSLMAASALLLNDGSVLFTGSTLDVLNDPRETLELYEPPPR